MVRSSGGKPPGTTAFNIEPTLSDVEDDPSVEVLDSLPIGMMLFEDIPLEDTSEEDEPYPQHEHLHAWGDVAPYWHHPGILPRQRIGDCFALVARHVLASSQLYPGDESFCAPNIPDELRFRVFRRKLTAEYTIEDWLVNTSVTVSQDLLEKPRFDISRWYAYLRKRVLSIHVPVIHSRTMGPALEIVATKLLTDGIWSHYPCAKPDLDPETRFSVLEMSFSQETGQYLIVDRDLQMHTYVPESSLRDPSFDLVGWYMRDLDQQGLYEYHYEKEHLLADATCPHGTSPGHHVAHKHHSGECQVPNMPIDPRQILD
jgi:hypothetical protein